MTPPTGAHAAEQGVSVVVPTKGRADLVEHLLASLVSAGEGLAEPFEILIVDDSDEPERQRVAESCRRHGAAYVPGPPHVGAKRNLGSARASFDLILFIDSDCTASPGLLHEHRVAHRSRGADVAAVVGPTEMFGREPFVWKVASRSRSYNVPFEWPKRFRQVLWGSSSNLSIRREIFLHLGGFDEQAATAVGGEDVDLGVRVAKAGYRIVSNPRALAFHTRDTITSFRQIAAKLFLYGRADVYLNLRHPGRADFHANPAGLALLATAGALPLLPLVGASALSVPAALVAALWVLTAARRVFLDPVEPVPLMDALCVPLDWSFDAGELYEAIRQRRPRLAFRRFAYQDGEHFRAARDSGEGGAGSAIAPGPAE